MDGPVRQSLSAWLSRSLRRIRALPPGLTVRLVCVLGCSRLLLLCTSPARPAQMLLPVRPRASHRTPHTADVIALTEALSRRLPWRPTCIERSLASARVLASAAVHGRVVVGIAPPSGASLQAHAWVEVGDAFADQHAYQRLTAWVFPIHPRT